MNNLTNQELLQELQSRIEKGKIAIKTNFNYSLDPLTSMMFKVSSADDNQNNSPDTGLSSSRVKTYLLIFTIAIILYLVVYPKRITASGRVEFQDNN